MGQVNEITYHGMKACLLEFGPYRAALLPEAGGNLIFFKDVVRGYSFLREPKPEEVESFKTKPNVHGIPVLFPPNRYEDGKFTFNGQTYQLPVNEAKTANHLHGFFYYVPWTIIDAGTNDRESYLVIEQNVDEQHNAYRYFPHHFTITLRYSLTAAGLVQHVKITNRGDDVMPCMLGFHTAINVPFAGGSTQDDCEVVMTIGERWELNERMLPTGKFQPLNEGEQKLKSSGITPFFEALDNHYTAKLQDGKNYMQLTDHREQVRFIYDVGAGYKNWMIWNCNIAGGFFCPEPQINAVNAPNLPLPTEQTGLVALKPGESWEETSRMYTEKF